MLAFLVFATWRCNRGPITRGLRFARKVKVQFRERLKLYYFSVEEIHSMAVLGTLIAAYQLQSTKRLPVKYVATGPAYPADAPIQPYVIDVGMSTPTASGFKARYRRTLFAELYLLSITVKYNYKI